MKWKLFKDFQDRSELYWHWALKANVYTVDSKIRNDADVQLCKQWLQICLWEHKNCNEMHFDEFVSTRLVDVNSSNSSEIHLQHIVELDLKDSQYLTLSHCWDLIMSSLITTTSVTLLKCLRSILLTNLTRTFLDCIIIVQKLNIQYIWIDFLCILQDSRSDWEQKIAQMISVYSNVYCIISIFDFSDDNDECHVNENFHAYDSVTLSWDNMNQKIRIFSLFDESILSVLINDSLTQRAWTLQKHELFSCVLHYFHDIIRWKCCSLKTSSTFSWEDSFTFNDTLRVFDVKQIAEMMTHELNQKQREKSETAWFNTMFKYFNHALTKHLNHLFAILRITQVMQIVIDDIYFAEFWCFNLLHCLLWTSM